MDDFSTYLSFDYSKIHLICTLSIPVCTSYSTENTTKLQTTFDKKTVLCLHFCVYIPSSRLSIAVRCTCRHGFIPKMLYLGTFRIEMSKNSTKRINSALYFSFYFIAMCNCMSVVICSLFFSLLFLQNFR